MHLKIELLLIVLIKNVYYVDQLFVKLNFFISPMQAKLAQA